MEHAHEFSQSTALARGTGNRLADSRTPAQPAEGQANRLGRDAVSQPQRAGALAPDQVARLTTTLPAQLALKYDLGIIPVFIERTKNNRFRIEFQNEIKANKFIDKMQLTKELNKILEKMIVRNPNQWIWTHDRWK